MSGNVDPLAEAETDEPEVLLAESVNKSFADTSDAKKAMTKALKTNWRILLPLL